MPIPRPLVLGQIFLLIVVVLCIGNAHARQERRIMKGVSDCGNYPWVIKTITVCINTCVYMCVFVCLCVFVVFGIIRERDSEREGETEGD
jgi:hypothetical protein